MEHCYNTRRKKYKGVLLMLTKSNLEQQIAELKMDYINLQGDIEKLENTGHINSVMQAEERLAKMEQRLAELNKQLAEF